MTLASLQSAWPRIALCGRFDLARSGDLLLARVHESELQRRLPGARVLPYSSLGPDLPIALDGGLTARRLGNWSSRIAARLAASADVVIVTGADLLTIDDDALGADYGLTAPEAQRRRLSGFSLLEGLPAKTPRAWSAAGVPFDFAEADFPRVRGALQNARYLSVPDDISRLRLVRAGVDCDMTVVPHPVALASRVFEPAVLARRLDYLRLMGWFPPEGAPIVVQGSEALAAFVEPFASALVESAENRDVPFLLLPTGPTGGNPLVDLLMPRLGRAFQLPASASLVDILAAFSGARCFIGDSVDGHMTALGFGVPSLVVSVGQPSEALVTLGQSAPVQTHPAHASEAVKHLLNQPRGEGLPASLAISLESHFDTLADCANQALAERIQRDAEVRPGASTDTLRALQDTELRLDATRAAWEVSAQQVAALRIELAGRAESHDAHVELGELEAMRAEFQRFTNLRLYRYTASLRRLYASLRRTFRRTGD